MQDLQLLNGWLTSLSQELRQVKARKKTLKRLMTQQGYSLKTIKGHTYLYVWKTVGHGKAKWKCLGNLAKIGGMAVIEELRRDRMDVLLKEWERLTQREEEIQSLVKQALEVLERRNQNSMEVVA
ncbi:hypothetical protein IAE16_05200 [Hydrogenobacter sp. T-2]|uniref:hypothetical protein n=1 Tax=Pampinifervens diazotrophicum TaxID=1632018 RepID=UPI002B25D160|nr:hypothetical protein [Hydrogenobacter sp. T-2]WPM31223.1 hypothetical protein IAE16_05200 [Hydrogenobacter sp. T-2]